MSSVRRSIHVLELLSRRGPLGVRAVAQQLNVPLGSAHRILLDLAEEAIVERTPTGEWELSYRLLAITGLQLERIQIPQLAHPVTEQLAEATGETVHLSAPSGTESVCIAKVQTNVQMQINTRVGSRGPMYCTGSGKALLAFMTPAEQDRIIAAITLKAVTQRTITDPDALRRDLDLSRRRGYSLDHEEAVPGIHCVGVPILNHAGRPVGAISVSGTSQKAAGPHLDALVRMLKDAGNYVSRRLGYSGELPSATPQARPARAGAAAGAKRSRSAANADERAAEHIAGDRN
jgi:IclR family acetate operon transcriptional repressor